MVTVSRGGRLIGRYDPLELGSLLETGHLQHDDLCLDPKTNGLVPLQTYLGSVETRDVSPGSEAKAPAPDKATARSKGLRRRRKRLHFHTLRWALIAAIAIAVGTTCWAMMISTDVTNLQKYLDKADAENSELKKKYQNVLFAARDVTTSDEIRGRVIIRNADQKRITPPGIKMRLFHRADMEAYLSARHAKIAEIEGTDPNRLALHFLKNMPVPVEATATDSAGRFEFKIPAPGEYVIMTSIRTGKSGRMRLWFVAFDSRDPLNTPVDITESNVVRQFNPIFMLNEGR